MKALSQSAYLNSTNLALIAVGFVLLGLFRYGLQAQGQGSDYIAWIIKLTLIQSLLYFGAAWIVWRAQASHSSFIIVVVFAALFRASILFEPPLLSDDVYRYIWDGRVQAAGINPYRYIPADEALAGLRDEAIYERINRRDNAHTIYPPVAQIFFLLVTRVSESVTWMKAALVACEALTMVALTWLLASFGWPPARALIFAWHPLLVWEIAGSGHVDALMIVLVALALLARRKRQDTVTGLVLACATLTKFFPAVLFPALYRRWGWKMPAAFAATLCLAYAPYLSVGSKALGFLPVYAEQEGLESGERFFFLTVARRLIGTDIPNGIYIIFALVLLSIIAAWSSKKARSSEGGFLMGSQTLAVTFTVLLAPHYTWYFAWLVPIMCFVPSTPVFYLTAASFVLYATWLGDTPQRLLAINSALYVPFLILGLIGIGRRFANRWKSHSIEGGDKAIGEEAA